MTTLKKIFLLAIIAIVSFQVLCAAAEPNQARRIEFTNSEKVWLQQNKIIKVANEMDWPPFDYNELGVPKGFSIDYIKLLAAKLDLEIEFVNELKWSELLDLFKQKKIDVLPAFYRNSTREEFTLFTDPYYKGKLGVFARKSDPSIHSNDDLMGKKIGIQTNDGSIGIVKKNIPGLQFVELDTNDQLVQALATQKVDAIIGNPLLFFYYAKENQVTDISLIDFVPMDKKQQFAASLHIGVRKDWPVLHALLLKAMSHVSDLDMKAIENRWMSQTSAGRDRVKIQFTKEELTWIKNNPEVTYSDVNWKPLSIIENNKMSGIMGDFLDLISERSGITFKFVSSESWPHVLEQFKDKKIDIVPGAGSSLLEKKLGLFSDQYAKYPLVIVTGNKFKFIDSLNDLKGSKIAIPKYYTSYNYVQENYPNLDLIETDNIPDALIAVQNGQADAFVGHIAPALFYISELNLTSLKVSGTTHFEFEHHYLMQRDAPVLRGIINKVFRSITEEEKAKIYGKWVVTTVEHKVIDYSLIYKIIAGVVVGLIIIGFWVRKLAKLNHKLNSEIVERRKVELNLQDLQQTMNIALEASNTGIWKMNPNTGEVLYYGDQWFKQIGYSPDDFVPDQNVFNLLLHPEDQDFVNKAIDDHATGRTDIYQSEFRFKAKDGSWKWIHSKGQVVDKDDEGVATQMTGVHLDITDRKLMEEETLRQKILLAETEKVMMMTNVFEKFVPKQFLIRIEKVGVENIELGKADVDNITILFSDIRSFTTYSEGMNPEELFSFLNEYLAIMNKQIHINSGFIDKFIGDAIMALFDHPDKDNQSEAQAAVKAAIGMQRAIAIYNQERKNAGHQPIETGIGIHSGQVMIGTIGSEKRMDFTVLGDNVNLASRVESLTKKYGVDILISDSTLRLLSDLENFRHREIDWVKVKGKANPVELYEIYNHDSAEVQELKRKTGSLILRGLTQRRRKAWDKAIAAFEKALSIYPDDRAAKHHIEQCHLLKHMALPSDWDGSIELDHK